MKIIYTKHALGKFASLKETGFVASRAQVKATILNPDSGPTEGRYNTRVVVKSLDNKHSLRVIYVRVGDIITVITFYPITKGRYEQKQKQN
ncbi:MAG: DUF4258 domain-containing protein [Candidatus Blackburnbacteria bacterium]|nr:DUF4258 domain-containing protein [Candidatus Blackburnbacteria bacterium]